MTDPLDPNYLMLSCKIAFRIIELQTQLIKVIKTKPDQRAVIDSMEEVIRELKGSLCL